MSTISAAIAPYLLWIKLAALAALIGGVAIAVVKHDARIARDADAAGYNRRMAEEAADSAKAKAAADWLEKLGAQATAKFHAQLEAQMPQIEETTHARETNIRIIYRDHPVPGVCVRPAGVLQQLEDARASANAAAGAAAH